MHEIEIPPDMILSITPGLEKLVQENRITIEMAQTILNTRIMPIEIAQNLGLVAHSGYNIQDNLMLSLHHSQSASPLSKTMTSGNNMPSNLVHHHNYLYNGMNLASLANMNLAGNSSGNQSNVVVVGGDVCPSSPIYANYGSGGTSPNTGGGGTSPMHQITRGISGLNTGGGSITRGTVACNEPLDLTMDVTTYELPDASMNYTTSSSWYVPAGFYDMRQLNLAPSQPVRIVPTPPTSPNLCIIQEENGQNAAGTPSSTCPQTTPTAECIDYLHSHPQICLTDVQGSEITLVALSDSSHDSEDSLETFNQHPPAISFQGLLITEPSSDMPSITRGVGRKTSLENDPARQSDTKLETEQDAYARRGSDKSLGFSDDSLSNDSNLSPCGQEPSGSSGFHSHSEHESRLSPDSLSDRRLSDEYYELPLPYDCSNLESSRILEIVKKTIDSKMPPKGFTVNTDQPSTSTGGGACGGICTMGDTLPIDASNLNIEYSSGLQVELQVFEGRTKENKGIKLRRISGDQLEYGKLCQQLITSLTVN